MTANILRSFSNQVGVILTISDQNIANLPLFNKNNSHSLRNPESNMNNYAVQFADVCTKNQVLRKYVIFSNPNFSNPNL